MGSHYTLLNALIEDGRMEEAVELFGMIFSRYMEGLPRTFFMRMISLYYSVGAYDKMFEVGNDVFSPYLACHLINVHLNLVGPSCIDGHSFYFKELKTVC